MSENAGHESRVDKPVYSYQDVQAFAHLASITRLLDYRDSIAAVQFANQLREFAPSEDARTAKLIRDVTEIRVITSSAMETLTEISNSLIARPHQVEAIQRELNTYPNGMPVNPDDLVGRDMRISMSETTGFKKTRRLVDEPPVPSPNTD